MLLLIGSLSVRINMRDAGIQSFSGPMDSWLGRNEEITDKIGTSKSLQVGPD